MDNMAVKKFNCGQSAGKTSKKILSIPARTAYYLSGFADGEASFNVSLVNRQKDYKHGWKVILCFNISQKDETLPRLFQKAWRCGTIRYRKDGICYFEVRSIKDIIGIVIPFFKRFPFLPEDKKRKLVIFSRIAAIVAKKKHLERTGIEEILKLRELMKVGRKRKYSMREILDSYLEKSP